MSEAGPALDQAAPVREGEGLDVAALRAWFDAYVPELAGQAITVEQFPKGHSNLTYLLRVGEREVVLRRPPFGAKHIAKGHDMGREHTLLSALHGRYALAPRPLAYCEDDDVLGAPFYVMERLRGLIIRKRLPDALAAPDRVRTLCQALVAGFAGVHAVDWRAAGLDAMYRGEGYVERQIGGWTRRYARAQTDDIAELTSVAAWLAAHLPPESAPTLIHNDFKHDNIVLDPAQPTRMVGLLDWEMATIGDPLMDLGTTLGYWVQADDPAHVQAFAFCPTNVPGSFTRQELVDAYQAASGREVGAPVFYYAYGLFKLAVVAQQIYRRFKDGHTQDQRFASFIFGVKALSQVAAAAIDRGRV